MRLFDTHAHFDGFAAEGRVAAVLARAAAAGVEKMCAVGSSEASNELVVRLAREHPETLELVQSFRSHPRVHRFHHDSCEKSYHDGTALAAKPREQIAAVLPIHRR